MPEQAVRGECRPELRADCARCFGLCCVAPAFAVSAEFAINKPAGQACPNLRPDFRCGIHRDLRARGFPGCAVYDCFGAGQQVAQVTFGGRDWRQAPDTARQMFDVFAVMRQLHELLWHLTEAVALAPAGPLHAELERMLDRTARLADGTPQELLALVLTERPAGGRPGAGPDQRTGSQSGRAEPGRPTPGPTSPVPTCAVPTFVAPTCAARCCSVPTSPVPTGRADLAGAASRGANLSRADLGGQHLRAPVPARRGHRRRRHQAAGRAGRAGALAAPRDP